MTTISIKIEDQTYEIHTMPLPKKGYNCDSCKVTLIIYTPNGGDFATCPICGLGDYGNDLYEEDFDKVDDDFECCIYCPHCHILYRGGPCIHAHRGCTDSVAYGTLIESFEYNGILYNGMPVFKSKKEAEIIIEKLLNKKNICTCRGNCETSVCSSAYTQFCYECTCERNLSHYFMPK